MDLGLILGIAIVIIVVGILLWAADTYLPIEASIKQLLKIVVIALLVVWILIELGVFNLLHVHL